MADEPYTKRERELRKAVGQAIVNVRNIEAEIDALFKDDDSERGKKLAALMNMLTYQSDHLLYFGLKFDFRKDDKAAGVNAKAILAHSNRKGPEPNRAG